MTRDEFCVALRQPRPHLHWGLTTCGEIRAWEPGYPDGPQYCPWTGMAHLRAPMQDYSGPIVWDMAARMLGADLIFASAVVDAADNNLVPPEKAAVRLALMEACGLEEVA